MTPFDRIEDLFEPLNDEPDETTPPASVDEAVDRYGFDEVYAALQKILNDEEQK
jgi:hypothetical protein